MTKFLLYIFLITVKTLINYNHFFLNQTIFSKLVFANEVMKAFTSILLSLSLLVSTTGLSVLKHYCGGELAATQVLAPHHNEQETCEDHQHETNCPHCETEKHSCHKQSGEKQKEKSHNCCDNEVQQFKVHDQFVFTSLNFKTQLTAITITPILSLALHNNHFNFTPNLKHYLREKLPNSYIAPELRVSIQSFII